MQVCFLGTEIAPSKEGVFTGGLVNNVVRLSKAFRNRGHQVHIITNFPRYHQTTSEGWTAPWAKVHLFEVKGSYASVMYISEFVTKSIMEVVKLLREENFHILNIHGGKAQLGLISNVIGRIVNRPLVFTLYCPVTPTISKLCLSLVDKIVAISRNVKTSLIKAGVSSRKITIIPPAVDTSLFNPLLDGDKVRERLGISQDDRVIMFLGNTTISKGIDDLLIAMRLVSKKMSSAKLIMVLDRLPIHLSRYQEIATKIRSLNINEKVIELGVSQNVHKIMAACDIFVAPFRDTTGPADIPLSILEAMAVGKPIVATKVGGIPEVISNMENGILVNPGDAIALARSILLLFQNQDLIHCFGSKAASLIEERYSINEVSTKTESVYKELF